MFDITIDDLVKAAASFENDGPDIEGPTPTGDDPDDDPKDKHGRRMSARMAGSSLSGFLNGDSSGSDFGYGFKLPEFEGWLPKETPYALEFEHALHGLDGLAPATNPVPTAKASMAKEARFLTEEDLLKLAKRVNGCEDLHLQHIGDDVDDAPEPTEEGRKKQQDLIDKADDVTGAETAAHVENIMGPGVTDEEKDEELLSLLQTKAAGDILKFADLLFEPEEFRNEVRSWAADAKKHAVLCEPAIMGYTAGLEKGGMSKAAALDMLITEPHSFEKDAVMRHICWKLASLHPSYGPEGRVTKAIEKRALDLGLGGFQQKLKDNPWLVVALLSSLLGAGGYGMGGWTGAAGSLLPVVGYTMMNAFRKQPDDVTRKMDELTSKGDV